MASQKDKGHIQEIKEDNNMDEEVKASVIIPVYNAQEFLPQCLDSILSQSLREIEIICVNDGSPDGSLGILERYAGEDDRIKIVNQKNQGAGTARNNGMKQAKGRYLAFLDSDDFFDRDMLAEAYYAAAALNADVCVFDADLYDHQAQKYKECTWAFRRQLFPDHQPFSPKEKDAAENIFRMFNGWPWDKLYRRAFIEKQNLEYQNLRTTNDMFFVFIALAKARRIVTVDKVLAHQRVNVKTSLSRTRDKSWDCFYTALVAMQDELKNSGLYKTYEKAFVNWALNFSLWQINTMQGAAHEKAYKLMKETGFEKLDITRHDRSYFFNEKEYNQFLNIYTRKLEG